MTRRHLRPEGWPPHFTFPAGFQAGDFVFLSGMTASDPSGAIVCPGDIVGQTRYIYGKVQQALDLFDLGLSDIVSTRDYITTTDGYAGTSAVRRELFGDDCPAATGIIVAGLLRREALIEIEVVAHVGH